MKYIPSKITTAVSRVALQVQKASPTTLFVAGVGGVVTTTVLASRATLRLDSVLEQHEAKLEQIEELDHPDYSAEDRVKDKAIVRLKMASDVFRLYLPSLAVGAVSVGLLVGSHNILTKRNAALTAAYATLDKGFREYRARVVEDLGEGRDRHFLYGDEQEETVTTAKDGKRHVGVKPVATGSAPYTVFFHEGNPEWKPEPEYNFLKLCGVQKYANDRLISRGHVFLNEILEELGFEHTPEGAVVGWVKEKGQVAGHIDFGIFSDLDTLEIHAYMTGREGELRLNFNVDGLIWDRI